jgi:hypothetical protein
MNSLELPHVVFNFEEARGVKRKRQQEDLAASADGAKRQKTSYLSPEMAGLYSLRAATACANKLR